MDTVFFIFINNRVYVGDFYKGKLKRVIFEEVDYWEVYGLDDLTNLLDHLNYPMHYKQFKGSDVKILIDTSQTYNYLHQARKYFEDANSVVLGHVTPFIISSVIDKGHELSQPIDFANKFYSIKSQEEGIALIEEEEEDKQYKKVSELLLYELMQDQERIDLTQLRPEYVKQVEYFFGQTNNIQDINVLANYIVLSPTIIHSEDKSEKGHYLSVYNQLEETNLVEGMYVKKGDALLSYKHSVQKLFNRIKSQHITFRSTTEGVYVSLYKEKIGPIWARKHEVLGVITEETCQKEEAIVWLNNITNSY